MKTAKLSVRDMALCALFSALTAICAWITVPALEIAFTMQTFAVFLTLGTLGGKHGTIAILIYLLIGAVGVPVFSGFQGGIGVLLGVTGGYLIGFLFSGLIYWLVTGLLPDNPWTHLLAMVLSLLICYVFGSAWFMGMYLHGGNTITLGVVLMKCVVPYLIPDGLKLSLAFYLSRKLKRFVPQ